MKKIFTFTLAAILVTLSVKAAGPTTSATAPAKITIISPLTITKAVDMDFGTVAVSTTAAAVRLNPSSTAAATVTTGTASIVSTSSPTAAKFTISGVANAAFAISIPSPVTVTDNGGHSGTAMSLALTCDQTGSAPNYTSTVGAGGTKDIYVGGTLSINANQTASTYQGTITVNVNYN